MSILRICFVQLLKPIAVKSHELLITYSWYKLVSFLVESSTSPKSVYFFLLLQKTHIWVYLKHYISTNTKNKSFVCLIVYLGEHIQSVISELPSHYFLLIYSFLHFFWLKQKSIDNFLRISHAQKPVFKREMKLIIPAN